MMIVLRVFSGLLLSGAFVAAMVNQPLAGSQPPLQSPWVESMSSRARLIAGGTVDGGQLAGVHIELADNWKTYWRSPGDAGIPPLFDWSQSRNVADVKVLYPAPRRYGDPAGETIGYKHEVVFPVLVTRQRPGEPAELKLKFDYAVCETLCVPAQADLTLLLGPGTSDTVPANLVSSFVAQVPVAVSESTYPRLERIVREGAGKESRLLFDIVHDSASESDLFVEGPQNWFLPLPREMGREDDAGVRRIRYELSLADLPSSAQPVGETLTLTIVGQNRSVEQKVQIP